MGFKGRSQIETYRQWSIVLVVLAFLALLWSQLEEGSRPAEQGTHSQSSAVPASDSNGPADLSQIEFQLKNERHQLLLDFERMISQNPNRTSTPAQSPHHGLKFQGERHVHDNLSPSVEADRNSPRLKILYQLKELQEHRQWKVDRDEAFVREVLRRAREDGWIIELDEDLQVTNVFRVKPEAYRESWGGAAQ